MANKIVNNSLETIQGIAKGMAQDAKQAITGNYPDEEKPQILPEEQKAKIKAQEARNIREINNQIQKIRQDKLRKQQSQQTEVDKKREKKLEGKKQESVWLKNINLRKGTKEADPRTIG